MPRLSAISATEVASAFAAAPWAERFPPVLTIEQACDLLQIPRRTLFRWLAEGRFASATSIQGKHRRFFRDRLVQAFFRGATQ